MIFSNQLVEVTFDALSKKYFVENVSSATLTALLFPVGQYTDDDKYVTTLLPNIPYELDNIDFKEYVAWKLLLPNMSLGCGNNIVFTDPELIMKIQKYIFHEVICVCDEKIDSSDSNCSGCESKESELEKLLYIATYMNHFLMLNSYNISFKLYYCRLNNYLLHYKDAIYDSMKDADCELSISGMFHSNTTQLKLRLSFFYSFLAELYSDVTDFHIDEFERCFNKTNFKINKSIISC